VTGLNSSLYRGTVRHVRLRPFRHGFRYRVYYGLFDLDELGLVHDRLRWFSTNRFNLFSLHNRDHGSGDGTHLRTWVNGVLADAGIDVSDGRVMLLAYPRVLGYVFNPISVWYAFGRDGRLCAVVHEVRNTFGDKHIYVVPVDANSPGHGFDKELHVSPFMDMDGRYQFSLNVPGDRLIVGIDHSDADGSLLRASLTAQRLPLTDGNLLRLFVTHPMLTLKVIGGIHWQAVRLWLKGAVYRPRPEPAARTISVVATTEEAR
jgi:DUF1365 family protein